MKKILLNELTPGMIIAESVITPAGQCILDKGVVLNRQRIMRLSFYNIDSVSIEISEQETVSPAAPPSTEQKGKLAEPKMPATFSRKIKSSQQFQNFQIDHSFVLSSMMDNFRDFVNEGIPPQTEELLKQVNTLFDTCKTSLDLFDMLHNLRSSGNATYSHFLNVALICRRIGKWLKLDEQNLDTLTLCGLFHDIGKLKIPEEILNKPGKYTDEEFTLVKKHPQFGYELLKTLRIDDHICKSALSHHERCDGTGYPSGLTQDNTDEFAMIVSIADVYDAMTAARSYRAPLCPFQVISNFEDEGLQKYKPKYILTFLSHIAETYRSNRVLLNDGRSAKIVMLNQSRLSRPIIQFDDGSCVDLSTQNQLQIQAVL